MIKWMFLGLGTLFLVGVFGIVMFVLHGFLVFFVVVAALALLVGAGNYLNSVLGIKYKANKFNDPRGDRDDTPSDGA
jgi:hypothetical protein